MSPNCARSFSKPLATSSGIGGLHSPRRPEPSKVRIGDAAITAGLPGRSLRAVTLGCKVNQYETELVRTGLQSVGYRDAQPGEKADLCLVNTCTITAEGDAKGRQLIRRLARENPGAQLVVMGCYATRAPAEIRQLPGVSEVIVDKRELPDWLQRHGVVDVPAGIEQFEGHQRAYVKVQDGCLLRCTYCIIPLVRPHMSSRPVGDIVAEVANLVANGYREIVLTGIHLGHYGVDWNRGAPREAWIRLADLLARLCELPGEFRLRLSSIEATEVTRPLLEVMARYADRVCPHLHICLQSGSDGVLRRMGRRWGAQRFVDRCRLAATYLAEPAFTTDVIVGFPGETEADFSATLDVCREIGFSKIHIFPFSPRPGTPAAEYADQVDKKTQAERTERLSQLEAISREAYYAQLLGRPLQVLVEGTVLSSPGAALTPAWHDSTKLAAPPGTAPPAPYRWAVGTSCRYATIAFPTTHELRRTLHIQTPSATVDGAHVSPELAGRPILVAQHPNSLPPQNSGLIKR